MIRDWILSLGMDGLGGDARQIITLIAALLYLSAFAITFFKFKNASYISMILWIAGTAVNAVIVLNNWIVNGYMPFVSMYQILTFLGVTYSLVYAFVHYLHRTDFMKPYFMVFQGILMVGVLIMGRSASEWSFPPALQSVYFIPHVFSYMVSYTLVAVAALMCVISFFLGEEEKKKYENGIYNLVLIGFPFMVAGMLLGAIWANACWGHFWAWDNKESWSLVTSLALAAYLHFRRQINLKKYAKVMLLLAFAFEIITLFFVGMFGGNSMHAYS